MTQGVQMPSSWSEPSSPTLADAELNPEPGGHTDVVMFRHAQRDVLLGVVSKYIPAVQGTEHALAPKWGA